MRLEAASRALITAEVRPSGLAPSSNVIRGIDFVNKTRLPENVIKFPEIANKLAVVTEQPAKIIEFPSPITEISNTPIKPEPDLIEKTKKETAYKPGRNKSYIDAMGRLIIRKRGRSGCRCDGDERRAHCRSRSCRNKDKEVKPIDIRAKANRSVRRGSERIASRSRMSASAESRQAA